MRLPSAAQPIGGLPIEVAHGEAERRFAVAFRSARPAAPSAASAASAASRGGRSASFTVTACSRPSRTTRSRAAEPGARAEISRISSSSFAIGAIVERDDDVVGPDAGAIGRRAGGDVLHQRAVVDRQLQRSLQVGVDVAQRDADVAARHAAARAQLRQDRRSRR